MNNHEKENALNLVTDERTYQVFAESPEDARCGGGLSHFVDTFSAFLLDLCIQTFNDFCVFLCSGWFNVLSKVRVCTPEQLMEMSHEQANPKNAVVSPQKTACKQLVMC